VSRYQWWKYRQNNNRINNNITVALPSSDNSTVHIVDAGITASAWQIDASSIIVEGDTMLNDTVQTLDTRITTLEVTSGLSSALENLEGQGYSSYELEEGLRVLMDMQRNGNIHALDNTVNHMRTISNGTI